MNAKTAEEKRMCPICKDTAKVSEFKEDMCYRCYWYLAPEAGGEDWGTHMIRIFANDPNPSEPRRAQIRPRGFWSDVINVREEHSFWKEDREHPWKISVTWSSGARDGTMDDVEAARFFASALRVAIDLAEKWKKEREVKS